MRPIWTGVLTFGLVTIPVKLYSAAEGAQEVHFRLLNSETLHPIKERRVDAETGKEVPWDKVVRGVEYRKGHFVEVSDKELKALPLPTAGTIEVAGFADSAEIDPRFLDRTYYLGPGQGGAKAYELFRQALAKRGKVAIGKVAIRTREHLAAIYPRDGALVLQTLYYGNEVRSAREIPGLPGRIKMMPAEEKMANQLVETMAIEFRPERYHSDYKEALDKLVRAKLEGKPLARSAPAAKVIDLQRALRESLERAEARRSQRRRRAAG
jgi:DNA end-binding protein Ku